MQKMTPTPRKAGTETFQTEDEFLVSEIKHALPQVQLEDYTSDGKPKVKAIEAILGRQVTEAQRDQAVSKSAGEAVSTPVGHAVGQSTEKQDEGEA